MKKVILIICCVTISSLMYSCKKENKAPIDWKAFQKCNDALNLDTTEMASRLVGTWKLKSWLCAECMNPGWHNPDKTVIATFTSTRTFIVTENSAIVAQGNWYFRIVDSNKWGLQSDSSLFYLNGVLYFCNNRVIFYDSYIDGTDNLFNRVN